MLSHPFFSAVGISHRPASLAVSPSLQTGRFNAPAAWYPIAIALNQPDAGSTGQSHGRGYIQRD